MRVPKVVPLNPKGYKVGRADTPISLEDFVRKFAEVNPNIDREELKSELEEAVRRKEEGVQCINCKQPIWAIGTALCGWDACSSCVTGTADGTDDYEIDKVCW